MTVAIVGPVRFETASGHPSASAIYTGQALLRPYQIVFRGVWHVQNRYEDGAWIYRAIHDAPGSSGTDPQVKED